MRQKHRNESFSNITKEKSNEKAKEEIYKTLLYSDIFDYPLKAKQLFLYTGMKMTGKKFLHILPVIPHVIVKNTVYYFLPGRESIVVQRLQREKISNIKLEKARRIATILGTIPTITGVGISGSLSMLNAKEEDDSDLFFITQPHTIWITRLFVYIVLHTLGVHRKQGKETARAICANMFIDADHSRFPLTKRNAYTAHEIVQVVPVVNKDGAFEKFHYANNWIVEYFPNFPLVRVKKKKSTFFSYFFSPIEYVVMKLQLWYMREHQTRETTTPFVIAFHPIDFENKILSEFESRLRKYKIKYSLKNLYGV